MCGCRTHFTTFANGSSWRWFCFFYIKEEKVIAMQSKRKVRYSIRFTKEENEEFTKNVKKALVSSKSEYLRKLALNNIILSKTDNENFREFLKVAGEQGKLQGLLKIFIMEYDTNYKTEKKILDLIDDIEQFKN